MSRYDGRDDIRSTGNDRAVDHRNPERIVSKDRWSGQPPTAHLRSPSTDTPRGHQIFHGATADWTPGRPADDLFRVLGDDRTGAGVRALSLAARAAFSSSRAMDGGHHVPDIGWRRSRYRRAFDAFAKRWLRCDALRDLDAVHWYFKKRRALDQRDWTNIAVTNAPRFQKLRRRFSSDRAEMLYGRWLTDGDAAFEHPAMPASPCGDLVMQRLDHGYDQFGQLPGEC